MKLTFFETETKGMQTTKQQKVIKTTKGYQNNKRLSKQQKVIKTTKGYQNNKRLSKQQKVQCSSQAQSTVLITGSKYSAHQCSKYNHMLKVQCSSMLKVQCSSQAQSIVNTGLFSVSYFTFSSMTCIKRSNYEIDVF